LPISETLESESATEKRDDSI